MDATPPFPVVSSQRQLTVIMFTDAVGFSAKMHEQELATLNRIERDREVMQRLFEGHAGTVLKTIGDGLLVQFVSAVQAVACAQEIQRHFIGRTDPTYAQSALRYRISVHLGDVFVGNGDVMGDGVNIAARLVALAPPAGIVISETVYEVVKNKLPLHVQRAGPQRLKGIKESITVYRVLLDAPQAAVPAQSPKPVATQPPAGPTRRSRKGLFALVLALGLGFGARLLLRQQAAHEEDLNRNQSNRAALGEKLRNSSAGAVAEPTRPQSHDFAGLVTGSPAIENLAPENLALRQAALQSVELLMAWLSKNLERYTKDRPLSVESLGDPAMPRTAIFLDKGQLSFAEGGASRRQEWSKLKSTVQGAIIASALLNSPVPVPPEVREGAAAFAYLHGLPEMKTALPR